MRSRYAGHPFTTSTAEIAAALEDVSIPTLLLSLVHITGDPRFIRDVQADGHLPQRGPGVHVGGGQGPGPRRGADR